MPTTRTVRGKNSWQPIWKNREMFPELHWVEETNSPHFVKCNICKTDISIANGGISNLRSHAKRMNHLPVQPKNLISPFLNRKSVDQNSNVQNNFSKNSTALQNDQSQIDKETSNINISE